MTRRFTSLLTDGTIRELVLDAPHRKNSLDADMLVEIRQAVAEVAADSDARALVISAAGDAFCAGADLNSLFGDTSRPTDELRDRLRTTYEGFLGIRDLRIPTIAAVNGVAVGAGINIALACDVVVVGPRAEFAITFAEIGLHPGGGCTWFLERRLGAGAALNAILEAAHIGPDQALATGLATVRAEDAPKRAREMANLYAERDPRLVRDVKRAVRMSATADLSTVLEFEAWAQAASVRRPRFQRYLEAFLRRASQRGAR